MIENKVIFESQAESIQPRTQAQNRDYRRKCLLQASITTVAQLGVEGATIAKICAQAGASRGMSAHYFSSKEDLLAASLSFMFETATDIKLSISKQGDHSVKEKINRCACSSFSAPGFGWELLAAWQAFISASRYTQRYKDIIKNHNQRTFEFYLTLFTLEQHQLRVSPTIATQGLMALLDGLWSTIASQQDSFSMENAMLVCDCYISGCFRVESNLS